MLRVASQYEYNGVPETEFLYINTGAREGTMEVKFEFHTIDWQFAFTWDEEDSCPVECEEVECEYGCEGEGEVEGSTFGINDCATSGRTLSANDGEEEGEEEEECEPQIGVKPETNNPDTFYNHADPEAKRTNWQHATVQFRFLAVREASARAVASVSISNPALYKDRSPSLQGGAVPVSGVFKPGGNSTNWNPTEPVNSQSDGNFGTSGSLAAFHSAIQLGTSPENATSEGIPSDRCLDGADQFVFRRAEQSAIQLANQELGEVFVQNSTVEITIGNNTYVFAEVNLQTNDQIFGQDGKHTDLFSGDSANDFKPKGENWHPVTTLPISGYSGRQITSPSRNGLQGDSVSNSGGSPFYPQLAWFNPSTGIVPRLNNGLYNFIGSESQNVAEYTNVWNGTGVHPIRSSTNVPNHTFPGVSAQDQGSHLVGSDKVRLEYLAWQEPGNEYSGQKPPNSAAGGVNAPTSYWSINPVIIHNPVSNIFAWAHDVPEEVLIDQRIWMVRDRPTGEIMRHDRALNPEQVGRFYIDFDFKITIPNTGTFQEYWHWGGGAQRNGPLGSISSGRRVGSTTSLGSSNPMNISNFGFAGIGDTPDGNIGQRGKGYIGTFQGWDRRRHEHNIYPNWNSAGAPTQGGASADRWNVSKWINAKYIQFPFDVYYYGSYRPDGAGWGSIPNPTWGGDAHVNGNEQGFYHAFTWIKLYDNGRQEWGSPEKHPHVDPTEFFFRVASHVEDDANMEIWFLSEAINSPYTGDPEFQWHSASEWNVNGQRVTSQYQQMAGSSSQQPQGAEHATRSVATVDVVGRIGNVVVDDSSDPQWASVFWETREGNPLTQNRISRGIASYYNMYESTQFHIGQLGSRLRPVHPLGRETLPGGFINRFSTLREWHNQDMTLLENPSVAYTLPVQKNPLPEYNQQAQKLGYENQISIQTVGKYGYPGNEMWVTPRYYPIGDFYTAPQAGNPNQRFYLYATDPFDANATMKMFWDSAMDFGNWQFAPDFVPRIGSNMARMGGSSSAGVWTPALEHRIYHTLSDTRAKISEVEKNSSTFTAAQMLGSQVTTFLGDPSFIRIPHDLMTNIGGPAGGASTTVTKGRIGEHGQHGFHTIESSPRQIQYQERAFQNAQRWHMRHSLPRTTQVIYDINLSQGLFEGRGRNQYIGSTFVFRTHADNGLWDLSTYTGSTSNHNRPYPDWEIPITEEPSPGRTQQEIILPEPPPSWNPQIPGQDRRGMRRRSREWVRPADRNPGFPSNPPDGKPTTPIIIVDYSNPAQTDRTTIGTH